MVVSLSARAVVLNPPNAETLRTVPYGVLAPNHKKVSSLLHNCIVVTVMNPNVNTCVF